MFFNRSFTEAYTKSSRTKMTMRLSTFVKAKIIKIMIKSTELLNEDKNNNDYYTIRSFKEKQQTMFNDFLENKIIIDENNKIELLKNYDKM